MNFFAAVNSSRRRFGAFVRRLAWLLFFSPGLGLPLLATQTNPPVAIFMNGPTNNRVNLVFLSEGYQTNQLGQFLVDATNAANNFLAVQPYAEYRSYFNVFAIGVSSTNSGSTHPYTGTTNKTYFNSSYDAYYDYLITIPASGSGQGQDRVNGLLKAYFGTTNNFLPVVLVNDATPGGSDNSGTAAITDRSDDSLSTIFIHESGHVLGNLGDEYTFANPGYPDVEEPNTTTNSDPNTIKWKAWIPPGTPIPTPSTTTYLDTVGLFQGAHYHVTGWYRPMQNCRMQNQSTPDFCPVCQEALVLAIYGKCRPIDSFFPATNKIITASAQPLNFSLNLVSPATHPLNVQWRTNGVAVPGATNATFSLLPKQPGTQTNSVSAVVWDGTVLVRNDPKNLLWQTNAWTLVTTLPALQLDSARWTSNNNFSFRVTGSSPDGVVVQASTNLINWQPLQTNLFGGQTNFYYTNQAGLPWRFYRAVTPP